MPTKEKIVDWAFALSFFYWGIAGFFQAYPSVSVVRVGTTVLNLFVGYLIIVRKPLIHQDKFKSLLKSIPSLLCGGVLFSLSEDFCMWSPYIEVLFCLGVILVLMSFWSLGESFSVFPSLRSIVKNGTYTIVRHPAYLGEILMCLSCVLSVMSIASSLTFLVYIPLLVIRIQEEENLLIRDKIYIKYTQKVKWKLIPYLY